MNNNFSYKPLIGLLTGNFAIGTSALMISAIVETMANGLDQTISSVTSLISIYSVSYAMSAIFLVSFVSKKDLKKVLLTGLTLFISGNFLTALSNDINYIYFYRIIVGVGASFFTPISSAVASIVSPKEHIGKAVSFSFSGLSLATVVGIPVASYFSSVYKWNFAFYFVALIGVLAFLKVFVSIDNKIKGSGQDFIEVLATFKNLHKLSQLSFSLVQMAAQFTTFALLVPYAKEKVGFEMSDTPLVFFIFGLSSFMGTILGGRSIDRFGSRKSMIITIIFLFISFVLVSLSISFSFFLLCLFMWGLFGFSFHPMQQVELIGISKGSPASLLSLNAAFMYLGTAIGTEISKLLASYELIYMLPQVSAAISVLLTGYLVIQKKLT